MFLKIKAEYSDIMIINTDTITYILEKGDGFKINFTSNDYVDIKGLSKEETKLLEAKLGVK